ncbi:MAG: hypothetical protein J2P50_05540 [Hyphomicrobiaceae bacterium]|nr:hypothetical protein [Hyphomicrobiaceae bacterium]
MAVASGLLPDASARIAELRKHLRPYWYPVEAGGIVLMLEHERADANEGFTDDFAARVPEMAAIPPIERWNTLDAMLTNDVKGFFSTAKLTPGTYRLENYHLDYAEEGKLPFDAEGNPPIVLPPHRTFPFTVTTDHLKLLRHLNTEVWFGAIRLIDPERPYGRFSRGYYFIEMAEALGDRQPPCDARERPQLTQLQTDRYLKLHREILFAAQAFWTFAE